jgi:hypothetical protein
MKAIKLVLMTLTMLFMLGESNAQMVSGGGKRAVKAVKEMSGNPVKGPQATKVEYMSSDRKIYGKFQIEGNYWVERNNQGVNKFRETHRDEWSVYLKDVSRANVTVQLDLWVKKVICKPWNSKYIITAAQGGYTPPFPEPNAWYAIYARHSGRAIDIAGSNTAQGAKVMQWDFHGGPNQLFRLESAGDGYYFIRIKHSGKYLDVSGVSKENGAAIHQWPLHRGANQQFKLQNLGGGYYRIIARHSGRAFDIRGGEGAKANGVILQQWDAVGGKNQHFRFVKR